MTEIVYGPPGTGKTTHLLNCMSRCGADPKRIGFLAFTRSAAGEALKRLGLRKSRTIRTLHSFAYEVSDTNNFQIVNAEKLKDFSALIGYRVTGLTIAEAGELTFGDELLNKHQFNVATFRGPENELEKLFGGTYTRWKRANGYRDYNDLLLSAVDRDFDFPIDWLFIDEGQDLSPLQWRLANKIIAKAQNVMVAGDDDQAIYTWAGADPHGMRKLGQGRVLTESYRVPRAVHRVAEAVASHMEDRVAKNYHPKDEEGDVDYLPSFDYLETPSKEESNLFLYRNHSARQEIEDWLVARKIAYTVSSGYPGAFEDRYSNAVRTFIRLKEGYEVSKQSLLGLVRTAHEGFQEEILSGNYHVIRNGDWRDILDMPGTRMAYLAGIDLFAVPTVKISTIHAAKGGEADHVILLNQMGAKTYEGIDDNEYRVWYVGVTRAKHRLTIIEGDNPIDLGSD